MSPIRAALAIRADDGAVLETRLVQLYDGPGVGELIELPDGTRVRVRGVEPGADHGADILVSATLSTYEPSRRSGPD